MAALISFSDGSEEKHEGFPTFSSEPDGKTQRLTFANGSYILASPTMDPARGRLVYDKFLHSSGKTIEDIYYGKI